MEKSPKKPEVSLASRWFCSNACLRFLGFGDVNAYSNVTTGYNCSHRGKRLKRARHRDWMYVCHWTCSLRELIRFQLSLLTTNPTWRPYPTD
jgi:hypothetical protein